MKENRPILFINSASTNNFFQKNQYVYDSRKKNNNISNNKKSKLIIEEQKDNTVIEDTNVLSDETINEIPETEKDNYEVAENQGAEHPEVTAYNEEVKQEEIIEINKPFANKIRLLTKRALLNRYVLVEVVLNDSEIEGLFKNSDFNKIILEVNEEDLDILIDDIVDIRIIRV